VPFGSSPPHSGTGKSHFAEALAHKAIDTGMRVAWFTLESLTAALGRAAVDGTTTKTIARITRCDLAVIDDIGMLPAGQAAAEALYRLVDAAYERRSLIITSNFHPSGLGVGPTSEPFRTRNGFGEVSAGAERGCLRVFGVRSGSVGARM
jgi:chromosomal replication initiation ATPase DnaA